MDVVEELPIAPNKGILEDIKDIYKQQPVVRSFVDIGSEFILNELLLPSYKLPKVQEEYKSQRLD